MSGAAGKTFSQIWLSNKEVRTTRARRTEENNYGAGSPWPEKKRTLPALEREGGVRAKKRIMSLTRAFAGRPVQNLPDNAQRLFQFHSSCLFPVEN
mmetsp:Transcript_11079/g.28006  ORF Transcript_11079/g.28006 Transcript_11079/m.28006 type:complete len:96 (+) Transcript_11079:66-353(+)